MFVISFGHKKASVELRQKFAFNDEKCGKLFDCLRGIGVTSAVYLATCNRCELYVGSNVYQALEVLADFSGAERCEIKNHVLIFEGKRAVRHLFSVACGLESMVLGEDEILGQVKRAFAFSNELGFTDYEFNTVFKFAVTAAKKIKTETMLSKSSVSVATLVASKCHRFAKGKKAALIIGAGGEIGSKICKNLLSYGDFEIFATVREKHIGESGVQIISYADRYSYIDKADVIISATRSPHFTVTGENAAQHIHNGKPRLFVDLSVPRDIDEAVSELPFAELVTIDDFQAAAERNNNLKKHELASAGEMLDNELDMLFKELVFHQSLGFLKEFSLANGGDDFMRFVYKFRDAADSQTFESFVATLKKAQEVEG
ncbi:MAG: glutamyl-tRNA reductase [Ruminococcus sp.]|nr:glutamyl-tRNA reductase [Ruminococcus sp.]